jgi:hypothetical protein
MILFLISKFRLVLNLVYFILGVGWMNIIQPMKMDLTEGSKTSEKHNLTPGKHPKENTQDGKYYFVYSLNYL